MSTLPIISEAELAQISARFEDASPQDVLRWALETYGTQLTMATAFGAEGCALIDMIARLRDETGITPDVFNLETGYQFPQTLALKNKLEKKYELPIRFVTPHETVKEMEAHFGGPIYNSNPDECCYRRKVLPLQEALAGFDAFITAIRRDQTPERSRIAIVALDAQRGLVKISPLANWSKDQVWEYLEANEVPTNPLHEQGFASIGCWPCTRAVADDEDERDGRWSGTQKRECGIHLQGIGRSTPGMGVN